MAFGLFSAPIASRVGGGSVLSGSGISAALGLTSLSDPLSAGLSVLSALGGGTKISGAKAETQSGVGIFSPNNKTYKNKPMINFGEPLQVAAIAVVAIIGIYIYKRVK